MFFTVRFIESFPHSLTNIFMKQVEIFTDGACKGNPGAGGWGALLRHGQTEKEISGGEKESTNNRMEMMAVIQALGSLKKAPCDVAVGWFRIPLPK